MRPFRLAGFSLNELQKRFNYPVSSFLWNSCLNTNERNLGRIADLILILKFYKNFYFIGSCAIKPELQKAIQSFLIEKSTPAANRTASDRNGLVRAVRYLDDNVLELYKSCPFKNEFSLSTFKKYKLREKIFKKPHRLSDLCEFCEQIRKLKLKLSKKIESFPSYRPKESFDIPCLIKFFNCEYKNLKDLNAHNQKLNEISNIMLDLKNLERLMFHKMISISQRVAYNQQREDKKLLEKNILIDLDYKQKIVIGMSPRQVNREFYDQKEVTCLGKNFLALLRFS
jgi:hypothetical protein